MTDTKLNNSTSLTQAYPVYYKHKTIAAFRVGQHQFKNHILTIQKPDDHDDFLREFDGLLELDQINIRELTNIENEKPVEVGRKVIRGSQGSHQASLAEIEGGEAQRAEIERREAVLLTRERELGRTDALEAQIAALLAENAKLRGGPESISADELAPSDPMAKTAAEGFSIHDSTMNAETHARNATLLSDGSTMAAGQTVEEQNHAAADAPKVEDEKPVDSPIPAATSTKLGGLRLGNQT